MNTVELLQVTCSERGRRRMKDDTAGKRKMGYTYKEREMSAMMRSRQSK